MTGDEEEGGGEAEATTATETKEGPAPEIETEAREMGWKPQSEWKGKPEEWKDASTWVTKGKEILPIVLAQRKKDAATIAELKESFKRLESMGEKTLARELERQRVQIAKEHAAQKREAVKLGDEDAYDKAEKAERAALKDLDAEAKDKIEEAPAKPRLSAGDQRTLDEWVDENPWFREDDEYRDVMDKAFDRVARRMPNVSMAEKLAEARKVVVSRFPDEFGRKPSNGGGRNTVEGGSRSATGSSKPSERLNAFEREAAQKSVAKGEYKTVDEWAKVYYE